MFYIFEKQSATSIYFCIGFSISVMRADQQILSRLDAPTKAPYWPVGVDGRNKLHFFYK